MDVDVNVETIFNAPATRFNFPASMFNPIETVVNATLLPSL
jgi:hypothetical protein